MWLKLLAISLIFPGWLLILLKGVLEESSRLLGHTDNSTFYSLLPLPSSRWIYYEGNKVQVSGPSLVVRPLKSLYPTLDLQFCIPFLKEHLTLSEFQAPWNLSPLLPMWTLGRINLPHPLDVISSPSPPSWQHIPNSTLPQPLSFIVHVLFLSLQYLVLALTYREAYGSILETTPGGAWVAQ